MTSLIDLDTVKNYRAKFPAWKDADRFEPGWEENLPGTKPGNQQPQPQP